MLKIETDILRGKKMIPRIIHYCWYGGQPLSGMAEKCLASWKEYCPDYEIKRWDESNTNLNENHYIREAYDARKWAFITDYIRLKVLFENGGIYMDTDVEVCKPLDSFLEEQAFSGFENNHQIPTGIMASEKGHPFIGRLLNYYNGRHFLKKDGSQDITTNVETITNIALENGFVPNNERQTVCGMTFYPHDYFCPKSHETGELLCTENTVCIHHFDGSWLTEEERKLTDVRQKLISKYGDRGYKLFKVYRYITFPWRRIRRMTRN